MKQPSYDINYHKITKKRQNYHCVKSAQIRSFFGSVFRRIRIEYGDLLSVFSPNMGKYGPEKNSIFGHFSYSVCLFLKGNKTMELPILY